MSVPRAVFERVGGFDEDLGALRREDWEWGCRVLEAGLDVVYAPEAVRRPRVRRHDARRRSAAPSARAPATPCSSASIRRSGWSGPHDPRWPGRSAAPFSGSSRSGAARCAVRVRRGARAGGLERVRARRWWARLYGFVIAGAWHDGVRAARRPRGPGGERGRRRRGRRARCLRRGPTARPGVHVDGEQVATVRRGMPSGIPISPTTCSARSAGGLGGGRGGTARPPPPPRRLDDVAVLFAWDAPTAAARARLEEAGAEVVDLGTPPGERWPRPQRGGPRDRAALRGGADARHLAGAGVGRPAARRRSTGRRVTLALGRRARGRPGASPLRLLSGRRHAELRLMEIAPHCVILRRERFLALGAFDPALAPAGHQGQILDVLERSLAAGDVAGYQEAGGLGVPTSGRVVVREQRHRVLGQGALVCRRACTPRGVRRGGLLRAPRGARSRPAGAAVADASDGAHRGRARPVLRLGRRWRCSPLSAAVRRSSARAATARPCPRRVPVTVSGSTPQRKS